MRDNEGKIGGRNNSGRHRKSHQPHLAAADRVARPAHTSLSGIESTCVYAIDQLYLGQ